MKTGILYICTGRYRRFWDGFYTSAEAHFMPGMHKEYFVWTDDRSLVSTDRVHVRYKECEGFPNDSLFRFDTILTAEEDLLQMDYLVFFNANAYFLKDVTPDEMLPAEGVGLMAGVWPVRHPIIRSVVFLNYERNPRSKAYIPPFGRNYRYYMGCLNGGSTAEYLQMVHTLAENTRIDLANGIVARVHDESHLNCYLRSHPVTIVPRQCAWPQGWDGVDDPKMIFIDKPKLDSAFDKEPDKSLGFKLRKICRILWRPLAWLLHLP